MSAPISEFQQELKDLINKHSMENRSNTPDYVLANYLMSCLDAFDQAISNRETWYKLNKSSDFERQIAPDDHLQECIGNCEFYPPIKTVGEMKINDSVGFNNGKKHWIIKRDE